MALKNVSNKPLFKKLQNGLKSYVNLSICLYLVIVLLRIFEIVQNTFSHTIAGSILKISAFSFLNDLLFWCKVSGWLLVLYLPLYFINYRLARFVFIVVAFLFFVMNAVLIQYFNAALVPLGADVYGYTINDIKLTVGTGGVIKKQLVFGFVAFLLVLGISQVLIFRILKVNGKTALALVIVFILAMILDPVSMVPRPTLSSEYLSDLTTNKANFFINESYNHFFPTLNEVDIYADNYLGLYENTNDSLNALHYVEENSYPFLHTDSTPNVLSAFFNTSSSPPNIVVIMVEGLGRSFSNDGAEFGSFTPFLDSLSKRSLYWDNFLSEGGRTFAVLPSMLASLPFGEKGMLSLGENMPPHISLMNVLQHNGYHTSFYYGGDASFDNMNIFFKRNHADSVNDEKAFPNDFVKMPLSQNGYTWGYGDKELYRRYFQLLQKADSSKPYLSALLTVSSHFPFLINEQQTYLQKFKDRMEYLNLDEPAKASRMTDANAFASILYTDDALRIFFDTYKKRNDFQHTIFIITGDHRIPEIAMSSKLDRFHVPFMIYSPMLKRSAKFSSISTHFDVTPSLLSFLKSSYNFSTPSLVSWIGTGLDTARQFQNKHAYAFKQSKSEEIDFIMGTYQLHNSTLYSIGPNLDAVPESDDAKAAVLLAAFNQYKQKNSRFINGAKLIPDSIYALYTKP